MLNIVQTDQKMLNVTTVIGNNCAIISLRMRDVQMHSGILSATLCKPECLDFEVNFPLWSNFGHALGLHTENRNRSGIIISNRRLPLFSEPSRILFTAAVSIVSVIIRSATIPLSCNLPAIIALLIVKKTTYRKPSAPFGNLSHFILHGQFELFISRIICT